MGEQTAIFLMHWHFSWHLSVLFSAHPFNQYYQSHDFTSHLLFNKTQIYDFRLHQASQPQTLISASTRLDPFLVTQQ